ncbi:MAG: VOC family protein [Bacillus sp. (in: firmicutes)]
MNQVCVISIYVPNLAKAIDFYENVLGFTVEKQYGEKIAALNNGELPLILEESVSSVCNPESKPAGVVLALKTNDIFQTVNELTEHKVDFIVAEPADCPPGKFISFKDPFGNVLEYVQFL